MKSTEHKEHDMFQNSHDFKKKSKQCYKIKAKNSELKHRPGYDVASSPGPIGMHIQGSITIFTVNFKQIITLMKEPQ